MQIAARDLWIAQIVIEGAASKLIAIPAKGAHQAIGNPRIFLGEKLRLCTGWLSLLSQVSDKIRRQIESLACRSTAHNLWSMK